MPPSTPWARAKYANYNANYNANYELDFFNFPNIDTHLFPFVPF